MNFSQVKKMRSISKKPIFFGLFVIIGLIALGFGQFGATAAPSDSIVGYVWQDLNADGIQDAGEPSIGNVTVNLFDPGADMIPGTGDDVGLASTTTFPTGDYIFSSLVTPDDYFVQFVIPTGSGFVFSPQGQGGDPLLDSNADVATGNTAVISLAAGGRS